MDFLALVGRHPAIVLVANSQAADVAELRRTMPGDALFVFFNDVTRVLGEPFDRPAILVARSGKDGPAIVRKNKIGGILGCFAPGALQAVVDLRCGTRENFVPAEAFGFPKVVFLDLTEFFRTRYTAMKTASSGYAMAAWLASQGLRSEIHGCGFTGRRSEKWKVFDVHDWAFERIALRLFETSGRLHLQPSSIFDPSAIEALSRQFPEIERTRFVEIGYEVLAQRIEHTDMFVERLWSVTKVGRGVREVFKVFRKRKGTEL